MRILLINQYAGSPGMGMEYRPHWMAREWQESGHEVLVVTANWTHLRRASPPVGRGPVWIEGVRHLTLPVTRHSGNGAPRMLNIASFAAGLWRWGARLAGGCPDLVIASSTHPFDVRPAAAIANRTGARLVWEVHDLWPLSPQLIGGLPESHPVIRAMQHEENFACRRADSVVSILPGTRDYLIGRGLDPKAWFHVPNGVPPALLDAPAPRPHSRGNTRVGYFGAHGAPQDLDTLLDAARLLVDEPIEFHLTGSGTERTRLMTRAADLPDVHFHQQMPLEEARGRMAEMDALCWGLKDSPLFDHGVSPNKLFEYMAVGLPVVSFVSTAHTPSSIAGCDISCAGGDPPALAAAFRRLMAMSPDEKYEMGQRGRAYVKGGATYPALASSMLSAAGL